ncbi:MAG: AtpZ/AtpI family protein [candidate division NC10 bacterium]
MIHGALEGRRSVVAMKDDQVSLWRQLAGLSSLGITFAASIAIGSAIGILLDRWLRTSPWFTILFFLFGVAAGFATLLKDLKRWGR